MKPLFIKKNGTVSKVSGIIMNLIPSYTLAEYNALTHKPLLWVRTDEDYAQIPSTDVSYGSGSVKDALDDINDDLATISGATVVSSKTAYPTYNSACSSGVGNIDQITCHTLTNGMRVIKGIFNITGDVTGKTILTLPNGYGAYAAGYTQQHWFIITSTSTNLSYIVIGVINLTAWGTLPPAGIYRIHEVF